MEEFSTFVWLGIAVVWFLTRLVRRGVKKATTSGQKRSRPAQQRPTPPRTETAPAGPGRQPDFSGARGGTGPPPIVPR